ncbi:hypothetical protein Poli38472_000330 [Pythium oligandrum]|uniref:MRH domain-containing protein n=1 Tax=Pythium oligandrum TaxID=41045 RepID=A0A8K1CC47_PYTOL|nr:hypothetical protein Poli38472_000330 [Pythium oligandrum]|eukprot:TMW60288.1 hypothetical protein Poli38472_000330 [Pythium oligandrum]
MLRILVLGLVATQSALALTSIKSGDPSYVVQIHASRDGFVAPEEARTQYMTTESGQRFQCYLPYTPAQKKTLDATRAAIDAKEDGELGEKAFLTFARAAVKKVRPKCLQYWDKEDHWVYEICPGVLVRKINVAPPRDENADDSDVGRDGQQPVEHDVKELAAYVSDKAQSLLTFDEFSSEEAQARLASYEKNVYTQVFRANKQDGGQLEDIKVQFVCGSTHLGDMVVATKWHQYQIDTSEEVQREPLAFAIYSRVFCDPKHADVEEAFAVSSLLRPLAESRTCIKRNEGWWTYEFCFGHGIRQYHREADGKITAEFSLGSYDDAQNTELEASGASLVSEHIDATHDVSRPAFVEMYTGGTHCKEFDVAKPRKSKVYYYCSQGGMNHHILAVKETQTCTYAIKISSPVVCDHPHFITEEQKSEEKTEVVHCVPVSEGTASEHDAARVAPADGAIREVIVSATQEY